MKHFSVRLHENCLISSQVTTCGKKLKERYVKVMGEFLQVFVAVVPKMKAECIAPLLLVPLDDKPKMLISGLNEIEWEMSVLPE